MIKVTSLSIPDVKLIQLMVHGDARGFFIERYNKVDFEKAGLPTSFVQDNHSRSEQGVIRGLHYQRNPDQGKLVSVIRGAIWDVVVDIRPSSPTYMQWLGTEIDDQSGKMLWVPSGFAHGFSVIASGLTDVVYKVDAAYNPAGEGGIRYDDPELKIDWRVSTRVQKPSVSQRDLLLSSVKDYRRDPRF